MADITKVKLGVCSVVFGGTDLGHTIGGVELNYEPDYHEISVDKYGSTVVERVLIGEKFSAKVHLAEFSIANMFKAIPQAVNGTTKLTIGAIAGKLATTDALALVLHPTANAAGDRSEDVVMYKAISSEPVMLPYKNDEERVFEVTFMALLDETKSDGNYLGLIGDSAT